MSEYNPPEVLAALARIKFRKTLVPIVIILVALIMQVSYGAANFRYLSLIALLYYLSIILFHRVNRSVAAENMNELLAPLSGKVYDINESDAGSIITIRKSFLHPVDIRLSDNNDISEKSIVLSNEAEMIRLNKISFVNNTLDCGWSISSKPSKDSIFSLGKGINIFYFPTVKKLKGVLTGIITGSGQCFYRLPAGYTCNVKTGERLEAGISVIGKKNE
jgi:hypothetical protein